MIRVIHSIAHILLENDLTFKRNYYKSFNTDENTRVIGILITKNTFNYFIIIINNIRSIKVS
jgi:hypothetical protein